ncbi:MAG: hypothetical protein JXR03_20585, partial [Cyclobacteriaceae bacterium]
QNTICDPATTGGNAVGQLTATVTGDADDNYTFIWYLGDEGDVAGSTQITSGVTTINNSTAIIDNTGPINTSTISQLPEGNYWVAITDTNPNNTGCTVTGALEVQANFTDITLDQATVQTNATDKTHCSAVGTNDNGSITINFADISGSGGAITNYTIDIDGAALNTHDASVTPAADPQVFSALAPDTYSIIITDQTTGCVSDLYQVVVGENPTNPIVDISKTEDNFCTGGNGSITLDVSGSDPNESDHNFDWYTGTNSSGTAFLTGTNEFNASNLNAGEYTIVVTALNSADDGRDCQTTVQVTIEDDPYALEVAATKTDVMDCTPDDGIITINTLTITSVEDGASNPAIADANVTYEIFTDVALTNLAGTVVGNVATEFTGLAPNTYYLTATYTGGTIAPGCTSPAVQFIIDDVSVNPTVAITEDA